MRAERERAWSGIGKQLFFGGSGTALGIAAPKAGQGGLAGFDRGHEAIKELIEMPVGEGDEREVEWAVGEDDLAGGRKDAGIARGLIVDLEAGVAKVRRVRALEAEHGLLKTFEREDMGPALVEQLRDGGNAGRPATAEEHGLKILNARQMSSDIIVGGEGFGGSGNAGMLPLEKIFGERTLYGIADKGEAEDGASRGGPGEVEGQAVRTDRAEGEAPLQDFLDARRGILVGGVEGFLAIIGGGKIAQENAVEGFAATLGDVGAEVGAFAIRWSGRKWRGRYLTAEETQGFGGGGKADDKGQRVVRVRGALKKGRQ